jgi:hypothetical protein
MVTNGPKISKRIATIITPTMPNDARMVFMVFLLV